MQRVCSEPVTALDPDARETEDRAPRGDPALWWILLLALAVRAGVLLANPLIETWYDETLHYVTGVLTANLGHQVLGHWGPGYETFLAAVFSLSGPAPDAARWAQVGVSVATVGLVYALARRAGGVRAGRIAATLCALYPTHVAYSHYLFSETLFTALLVGAVGVWFRRPEGAGRLEIVGAGLLFGLAALTRSVALYFLPCFIVWLALRGRRAELRAAAGVLAVALLTIAPWTLRNAFVYDDFLLVDGTFGLTAYWAYNEEAMNMDLGYAGQRVNTNRPICQIAERRQPFPPLRRLRSFFPPRTELDARTAQRLRPNLERARGFVLRDHPRFQRCEIANAWRFAREHPGLVLERLPQRFRAFWGPNSFLLRSVLWGAYPRVDPSAYALLKGVVPLFYVAVVVAALLALGRAPMPPVVEWIALFTAYYTAAHVLAVAYSRYRLPLMPLLMVVASLWLARPRVPDTPARRLIVGLAIAAFVALAADYWWRVLP